MWEYKISYFRCNDYSDLTKLLNVEGNDNWEVIIFDEEKLDNNSKIKVKVLFKRKK